MPHGGAGVSARRRGWLDPKRNPTGRDARHHFSHRRVTDWTDQPLAHARDYLLGSQHFAIGMSHRRAEAWPPQRRRNFRLTPPAAVRLASWLNEGLLPTFAQGVAVADAQSA